MKTNKTFVKMIIFFSLFLTLLVTSHRAQDKEGLTPRDIKSDSFVKERTKISAGKPHKSRSYKYKRKTKRYRRRYRPASQRTRRRPKPKAKPKEVQIGVTMWKLRPPLSGETGPLMNVQISDTVDEKWIPERVEADTRFREGDMIRLAVESTVKGYLYIINSEMYTDGSLGDPRLIFPESLEEDNRVEAGLLVDIPDQTEDYPYFKIATKRKDYAGEALLIVVVRQPLTKLKIGKDGKVTSLDVLREIEEEAEAQIFSLTDGVRTVLTSSEQAATCGIRSRDLIRVKKKTPCGGKTKKLTADSPPPQTIYRTNFYPGEPVAFPVVMRVTEE